jgi:hypothetical protein
MMISDGKKKGQLIIMHPKNYADIPCNTKAPASGIFPVQRMIFEQGVKRFLGKQRYPISNFSFSLGRSFLNCFAKILLGIYLIMLF